MLKFCGLHTVLYHQTSDNDLSPFLTCNIYSYTVSYMYSIIVYIKASASIDCIKASITVLQQTVYSFHCEPICIVLVFHNKNKNLSILTKK